MADKKVRTDGIVTDMIRTDTRFLCAAYPTFRLMMLGFPETQPVLSLKSKHWIDRFSLSYIYFTLKGDIMVGVLFRNAKTRIKYEQKRLTGE